MKEKPTANNKARGEQYRPSPKHYVDYNGDRPNTNWVEFIRRVFVARTLK